MRFWPLSLANQTRHFNPHSTVSLRQACCFAKACRRTRVIFSSTLSCRMRRTERCSENRAGCFMLGLLRRSKPTSPRLRRTNLKWWRGIAARLGCLRKPLSSGGKLVGVHGRGRHWLRPRPSLREALTQTEGGRSCAHEAGPIAPELCNCCESVKNRGVVLRHWNVLSHQNVAIIKDF